LVHPKVTVAVISVLLLLCAAAILACPVMTHGLAPLLAVAALLAGVCVALWRRTLSRWLLWPFGGVLGCWLVLLCWGEVCAGGRAPPAKSDPEAIRIVTWNVHCGQDEGPPWQRFDWPARKRALGIAVAQVQPDILCVQEARPGQVAFLEQTLPDHVRVGVGRDDGAQAGEHCAIFFDRGRFEQLDGGTFWLEEPTDSPGPGSELGVKRICTWVRLLDRTSDRVVRLYNSHLPLTESGRRLAADILLERIAAGEPSDVVVVAADFNAGPSAISRHRFAEAGLVESALLAGERPGLKTLHFYGIPLSSIDGILVGSGGKVDRHLRLDAKPGNLFPSDHFGLLTDLSLDNAHP
jgi:endonuclease/exonuclease/phosphatase family metal-dependent hydrolase